MTHKLPAHIQSPQNDALACRVHHHLACVELVRLHENLCGSQQLPCVFKAFDTTLEHLVVSSFTKLRGKAS
jgi:hypothetical protein